MSTNIKFGLIAGSILIALFLLAFLIFGLDKEYFEIGEVIGYTTMILSLLSIYFGVKRVRDVDLDGKISYKKAFFTGIQISLIASIMFAFYSFLIYEVFYPDFGKDYKEYYIEKIEKSDASQAEKQAQLDEMESMSAMFDNSYFQSFLMFLTIFLIGLVISVITAALLKTDRSKLGVSQ